MVNYYDYKKPVPKSSEADDAYLSDSFFGGDSRMGSLALYSDLSNSGAEVYYGTSLSLWGFESQGIDEANGATMYDLLMNTTRNNIYILVGINEIRNTDFTDWGAYFEEEIVKPLIDKNPNINIYLMQSYLPRGLSGISDEDLKKNIDTINGIMQNIAEKYHQYVLNIDDSMKDESGMVIGDYVWDGLHFNPEGAQAYADYIRTHVARREDYVKEVCE